MVPSIPCTLAEEITGAAAPALELRCRPLRPGLEAQRLLQVRAAFRDPAGRRRLVSFVYKEAAAGPARELAVYEALVGRHVPGLGPRVLAARRLPDGGMALALELIRPPRRWPWSEAGMAGAVLGRVAELHALGPDPEVRRALSGWDHEGEREIAARATAVALERAAPATPSWRRSLPAVRRLALQVRDLGRDLHASAGSAAIHGDLHPGNVLVRRRAGSDQPILLDWGRARLASPLEDVASWLQSLGCWEPEARRRHDTLLRSYLAHRGSPTLGPTLREAYWMAGARNALSGALAHHLGEVARGGTAAVLGRAHRAIEAWLRVLRTADASRRG